MVKYTTTTNYINFSKFDDENVFLQDTLKAKIDDLFNFLRRQTGLKFTSEDLIVAFEKPYFKIYLTKEALERELNKRYKAFKGFITGGVFYYVIDLDKDKTLTSIKKYRIWPYVLEAKPSLTIQQKNRINFALQKVSRVFSIIVKQIVYNILRGDNND